MVAAAGGMIWLHPMYACLSVNKGGFVDNQEMTIVVVAIVLVLLVTVLVLFLP